MSSSLYGDGTSDTSTAADADISPPDAVGPLATAFSAAYRCDAASLRIIHRTDRAGTECAAAFASMATALLDARARFAADCRVTLRARCSRLDKQHEEVDAVEKILEAGARLCCVNASDPEALSNAGVAVAALVPLCGCSTIPVRSSLIHVDHVAYVAAQAAITACVRVQTGPSLVHTSATGPGTQCLVPQPTADNSIVITCADEAGEPFRDLLPSDVEVVIDTPGVSVGGEGPVPLPLTGSSFSFSISVVESVCREDVTVRVLLIGVEVFARAIKVRK